MAIGFKHGSSGGDLLGITVVSGTARPSAPKENTIWVNSESAIVSWVISPVQPNGTPGQFWIKTNAASSVSMNAIKKNGIIVKPWSAYEYTSNGGWEEREVMVYQSEEWREIDTSLYIYNNGTSTGYSWKCNETMKQTSSGYTAAASRVTVGDTTVTVKCATRGYDFANIFTTDSSGSFVTVDLSEYTKVRIKGAVSGASTDTACVFRVLSEMGDLCTKNNVLSQSLYTGIIDATIDISSVNTSGYIGFTLYNSNQGVPELVLSELWLE